jgi:hypothetical protein
VYGAFERSGGWSGVKCPECRKGVTEEEARGLVLIWEEEGES